MRVNNIYLEPEAVVHYIYFILYIPSCTVPSEKSYKTEIFFKAITYYYTYIDRSLLGFPWFKAQKDIVRDYNLYLELLYHLKSSVVSDFYFQRTLKK